MPKFTTLTTNPRPKNCFRARAVPMGIPTSTLMQVAVPETCIVRQVMFHTSSSSESSRRAASSNPSTITLSTGLAPSLRPLNYICFPASGKKSDWPNLLLPNSPMVFCVSGAIMNWTKALAPSALTLLKRSGFTCMT